MEEEIPITVQSKVKNQNIPWVEKYRPDSLDSVISHEYIVSTIKKFIEEDKKLPNLLFYGPPGTGKTSLIVALAKQLYGKNYKQLVLELNASDERGINVVRDQIKTFASSASFGLGGGKGTKLIILDEADSMTNQAQFALRRIIEKFSSNARFCMICNYVSKIIPALQSRCTRFKFKHIPYDDAKNRIGEICTLENLKYKESGIEAVFKLCDGDMRRVVNMLQSLSLQGYSEQSIEITSDLVYKFTGNATPADIEDIIKTMLNLDIQSAFQKLQRYQIEKGISLQVMLKEINMYLMNTTYPSKALEFLVKRLADIEYRMSINCDEKLQLLSLISAFTEIRQLIVRA